MKLIRKIFLLTLALANLSITNIICYPPTNFFKPFEHDFRLYEWKNNNFRIGASGEYGQTNNCRDWDENKHNVLQMYNAKESSIAMLLGAPKDSVTDKLAKSLGVSAATATQDDNRGRFILTGEYEEYDVNLFAKYKLPINIDGTIELSCFIPFKSLEIKNVKWQDQTQNVLTADKEFKDEVSSILSQKAQELGNLDISANGFKKDGLSDIVLMLGWRKDFRQDREYLKNVRLNAKIGLTIPTGEKKDEDKSLSLPMGQDGAWSIPVSLGMDLDLIKDIRAGVDLSFLGVFDTTRNYRMKTSIYQTDYLLLNKGLGTKSQGASWQFTLFTQAKKLWGNFSGTLLYHFLKHDEDRIYPKSYDFDYSIVNSAQSLKEWNSHSLTFRFSYDPMGRDTKSSVKPHISLFYKMPITGKRVIMANTFGLQVACSF